VGAASAEQCYTHDPVSSSRKEKERDVECLICEVNKRQWLIGLQRPRLTGLVTQHCHCISS